MEAELKINTPEGKKQLVLTYIPFLLNGLLALSIGSLLPFIREARGLNYAFAGMIVSLHSVGNFISSFFAGAAAMALGKKRSILIFNSCYALSYILIIFCPYNWAIALAFLMTGLARGATSNFANSTINDLAPGKASYLNGLHAMFSIGALLFPAILTGMTKNNPSNWIYAVYMMVTLGILSFIIYLLNPAGNAKVSNDKNESTSSSEKASNKFGFFKEPLFYLVVFTLFFYLCAEQGVIGWMVTYFSDTGLLDESLSQLTGTIMWAMMLIGRLFTAYATSKYRKENLLLGMSFGVVVFFIWLLLGKTTPLIAVGIMGFGLSMAGIYATTVSFAGSIIKKYELCWSFILTMASLGSILMPSIIGAIAEGAGIAAGMSSVAVVVVLDFILVFSLRRYLIRHAEG